MIIMYNVVPAKTNQASLVSSMTFQGLVMMFACMNIHIEHKLSNFTTSCQLNVLTQAYLIYKSRDVYEMYLSLKQACDLIWAFYEKRGERITYINTDGQTFTPQPPSGETRESALAHKLCSDNSFYYYCWFFINVISTLLRTISLYYLVRGQLFLTKREAEKNQLHQNFPDLSRPGPIDRKRDTTGINETMKTTGVESTPIIR